MTKRLVDIDDDTLRAARSELGTLTIKDTVNEALRRVADDRRAATTAALAVLSEAELVDRDDAWR